MGTARPSEVWRRQSFVDLPEDARLVFARAREMARLCGATSAVEEIEYIALAFIQQCEEEQSEWRARCTTPEAQFRLAVLTRDGFRCVAKRAGLWECETSRNLTVHHVVSRDKCRKVGNLDLLVDPANAATLCAPCHERVQPHWQEHVAALLDYIASVA